MFKKLRIKFQNAPRINKILIIIIAVTLAALIMTYSVFAWFSYQRKLGDMQFIDAPGDLYITAGHGEALKYLDLKEISVTDVGKDCTYIVFGVRGSEASGYNLQFSFTTNNQFEYFLYPAKEISADNYDIEHGNALVEYISHNDDGTTSTKYFYEIDTTAITNSGAYTGNATYSDSVIRTGSVIRQQSSPTHATVSYLNLNSSATDGNSNPVIMADTTLHDDTYNYDTVQDFAEPLYMQAKDIKSGMDTTTRKVLDYYILEINWKSLKTNAETNGTTLYDDKETDILYICVEATTVM